MRDCRTVGRCSLLQPEGSGFESHYLEKRNSKKGTDILIILYYRINPTPIHTHSEH